MCEGVQHERKSMDCRFVKPIKNKLSALRVNPIRCEFPGNAIRAGLPGDTSGQPQGTEPKAVSHHADRAECHSRTGKNRAEEDAVSRIESARGYRDRDDVDGPPSDIR